MQAPDNSGFQFRLWNRVLAMEGTVHAWIGSIEMGDESAVSPKKQNLYGN